MYSSLQVRITRAGKEIGTYDSAEALRLLGLGTLKPTDHYWHLGMGGWELLSQIDSPEGLRLRAEAEERMKRYKAWEEASESNQAKLEESARRRAMEKLNRLKADEESRARFAEERAKSASSDIVGGNGLGCLGGLLFVGGVAVVLNAFSSRDQEQRQHNGVFGYIPGTRTYEKIDSSGYEAVAFIAGAVALLGLGLIIAGLSRKK